jgi:1-deoxy-D-xylulose-5-phosphate synthase
MLSTIPDFTVFSPANDGELRECLRRALYEVNGPVAVRYPRGTTADGTYNGDFCSVARGVPKLAVTYGRIAEKLSPDCDLLRLVRIKPLPEDAVTLAMSYSEIEFFEEGSERGGIGEALLTELVRRGWRGKYEIRGVTGFVPCAGVEAQLARIVSVPFPFAF